MILQARYFMKHPSIFKPACVFDVKYSNFVRGYTCLIPLSLTKSSVSLVFQKGNICLRLICCESIASCSFSFINLCIKKLSLFCNLSCFLSNIKKCIYGCCRLLKVICGEMHSNSAFFLIDVANPFSIGELYWINNHLCTNCDQDLWWDQAVSTENKW